MSTNKIAVKVYLNPETVTSLQARHPGYGEAGRVIKELIEAYVLRTKNEPVNWKEIAAAASQVTEGKK